MDFFKSVFSTDPLPSAGEEKGEVEEAAAVGTPASAAAWGGGFGGLMKTLASRSESMIQTYRRDLEEFGSGLRKETAALREAIRDLPTSLEAGAAAAQGSLESVGQTVDGLGGSVWRSATGIVAQGKDVLLSPDEAVDDGGPSADVSSSVDASARGKYSRLEAQVLGIQSDPATFTAEPEDAEDFRAWAAAFPLAENEEEIESLMAENGALEGNFTRLVPNAVDYETFWIRYFYRVHKLKQAEDTRANLVRRAISREEEEEDLSWEVDDDDNEEKRDEEQKGREEREDKPGEEIGQEGETAGEPALKKEIDDVLMRPAVGGNQVEISQLGSTADVASAASEGHVSSETKGKSSEINGEVVATNPDDQVLPEGKTEPAETREDRDVSATPSEPSIPEEEDDLGWDEIEDLGEHDEKKVSVSGGSPNKVNLHKRFSAAEEDEDLSWDIEDD